MTDLQTRTKYIIELISKYHIYIVEKEGQDILRIPYTIKLSDDEKKEIKELTLEIIAYIKSRQAVRKELKMLKVNEK